MATMKKTVWCQVLKFLPSVVPVTSYVMAGGVFLCLESVMAIVIVLMAVMNKTVQNRKVMDTWKDPPVAPTSLCVMVAGVLIRPESVMADLTVLMDQTKGTVQTVNLISTSVMAEENA